MSQVESSQNDELRVGDMLRVGQVRRRRDTGRLVRIESVDGTTAYLSGDLAGWYVNEDGLAPWHVHGSMVDRTELLGADLPAVARAFAVLADPRVARELRRRAIDAVLAEDARRHPEFATARRCAVMAYVEQHPNVTSVGAQIFLDYLHRYESSRGGGRLCAEQLECRPEWMLAYERARSM